MAYIQQFYPADLVIQDKEPSNSEFNTKGKVMVVDRQIGNTVYFAGYQRGFDVERYRKLTSDELNEYWFGIKTDVPNVKIDPKISLGSTKDGNPKDGLGDKKVPLWLCSPIAKAAWSVAQFVGMTKYGAWNWRVTGVRASVYLSAMQRHMDRYLSGEEIDPVDKTPHLGHIMACCAIILDAKAAGKLTDDRPPVVGIQHTYADVEEQMRIALENYGHMKPKHMTVEDTQCQK